MYAEGVAVPVLHNRAGRVYRPARLDRRDAKRTERELSTLQ